MSPLAPPPAVLKRVALTVFWFLLPPRGQIKLADFGLARLYNSEER